MSKILLLLSLLLFTDLNSKQDTLIIFYSTECPECLQFFEEYGELVDSFFPLVRKIDVALPENYRFLEKYDLPSGEFPIFYWKGRYYREKEFLEEVLEIDKEFPESPGVYETQAGTQDSVIEFKLDPSTVYFVYKGGCRHCSKGYYVMKSFMKKHPDIKVNFLSTESDTGYFLLLSGTREGKVRNVPFVYYGGKYLDSKELKEENLEKLISESYPAEESVKRVKIPHLSLIPVISAALIDGINPCVFTTFIFLLSYLSFHAVSRRKMLKTLLVYSAGVFTFYFLAGLGLMNIMGSLEKAEILRFAVKLALQIVTLVFAILSLKDYFLARKGQYKEMTLKLSDGMRRKIHDRIRKWLFYSAFVAGFLVSSIELACTGEVYLPTIMIMLKSGSMWGRALFYLLIYNLFFLVPLFIIGIAFIYGGEEIVRKILKENVKAIKLTTAMILFLIFVYLTIFV